MPSDDFLPGLREICDDKGVQLIFDEVQSGFGRTGKIFACEHWNVVPDILCLAKSVAGGLPMGATIAKEEIMASFQLGEHSSTFSGNPLVCAAASAAIDVLIEKKLPERAATLGEYFMKKLEALHEKYKIVREVRGLGLMIGMETRFDVYNIILGCMDRGVLVLDAGRNVLRFLPPLVIEKKQIDRVVDVLDFVMAEDSR
jgi:acetylornithine/LysW-gamma-L-lysine aminotransferase